MTFTILSDNRTTDNRFAIEHGLSVYIESRGRRLLLDTGASEVFMQNARTLGIDLQTVDYVFLSHGHADHTGGLRHFLEINHQARSIMSNQIVGRKFYSKRNYLHSIIAHLPLDGIGGRLMLVEPGSQSPLHVQVADGIWVIANIPHEHPLPSANSNLFVMNEQGQLVNDDFCHEMAIYVDGLLFTGCAHSGLLNILDACPWPLHTVVGGFHLLDSHRDDSYEQPHELEALACCLKDDYPNTTFYTSHCTGNQAFSIMHDIMGDQLQPFSCGTTWQKRL